MKTKIKYLIAILLASAGILFAQSIPSSTSTVQLGWSASVSPNITNYSLWFGTNSGSYYSGTATGTNLQCVVANLTRSQTYFFAVTATDTNGLTSGYSSEATYTVRATPLAVTTLHITIIEP
jgi:hypothetical protein